MVDMHVHTNHSDGDYSVEKMLEAAEKNGVKLLSITDHDTISAYSEFDNIYIKKFSGEIMFGVELTTTYNGEIIEILGYGFDIDKMNDFICKNYDKYEDKQRKQYELIIMEYGKRSFVFDENNVKFNSEFRSWKLRLMEELKKYSDNYNYLFDKGSFDSYGLFFRNEVFNPKSSFYVSQSSLYPSLKLVLDAIHDCGGLAFLAHPYIYSCNIINSLADILDNYNIDGLECFYSTFSEEQTNYLLNVCKNRNLFVSGGSDCHGTRRLGHDVGVGNGNLNISFSYVKDWVVKLKNTD